MNFLIQFKDINLQSYQLELLDSTTTYSTTDVVLSKDSLKIVSGFPDKIPFGLNKAVAMEFEIDFENFPATYKSLIKRILRGYNTIDDGTDDNIWQLSIYEASTGLYTYIKYTGIQLSKYPNEYNFGKDKSYKIKCLDSTHSKLQRITPETTYTDSATTQTRNTIYEKLEKTASVLYRNNENNFYYDTLQNLVTKFNGSLQDYSSDNYSGLNVGLNSSNFLTTACDFYNSLETHTGDLTGNTLLMQSDLKFLADIKTMGTTGSSVFMSAVDASSSVKLGVLSGSDSNSPASDNSYVHFESIADGGTLTDSATFTFPTLVPTSDSLTLKIWMYILPSNGSDPITIGVLGGDYTISSDSASGVWVRIEKNIPDKNITSLTVELKNHARQTGLYIARLEIYKNSVSGAESVGGFYNTVSKETITKYKTLWDLMKSLSENFYLKIVTKFNDSNSLFQYRLFDETVTKTIAERTLNLGDFINISIKENHKYISKSTTYLKGMSSDMADAEPIKEVTQENTGTINQARMDIKPVFHNHLSFGKLNKRNQYLKQPNFRILLFGGIHTKNVRINDNVKININSSTQLTPPFQIYTPPENELNYEAFVRLVYGQYYLRNNTNSLGSSLNKANIFCFGNRKQALLKGTLDNTKTKIEDLGDRYIIDYNSITENQFVDGDLNLSTECFLIQISEKIEQAESDCEFFIRGDSDAP